MNNIRERSHRQQVKIKETLRRPQQKWTFEGLHGIVLPLVTNETLPLITETTATADGKNSGIEGVNGHEALLKIRRRGMLHSQQMVREARTSRGPFQQIRILTPHIRWWAQSPLHGIYSSRSCLIVNKWRMSNLFVNFIIRVTSTVRTGSSYAGKLTSKDHY